jgi:hypothetical protein
MAEQLKIVIDADVQKAVKGIKDLDKTFKSTQNSADSFGKTITSASQKATAALAKIPNTSNSATFALTNLGRVAQDLPFGFLGIANNLNPLLESFQRLKAESGSTKTALKALGSSLMGAGGLGFALSAVSSLLIVFGDKIFGAGKKAKDGSEQIRSALDIIGDSTASVQGDIAKINSLTLAFKDASSLEKQTRILNELKDVSKTYFGDLKAGKTTFEEISKAANQYTEALVSQAIVKGFSDEISKVSGELSKAKVKYREAAIASSNYNEQLKKIRDLPEREHQRSIAFTTLELEKQLNGVVALQGEFNRLSDEIQNAVGESLKFKSPTVDTGLKKTTDDLLQRMQAFVKEFGDVFVVPDLEISFTNTEAKVKAAAIKLNDDINKGLLITRTFGTRQIQIPVELDLSFKESLQKTRDNLFKNANIFGDNTKIIKGIVPGASEDVVKRQKALFDEMQKNILATAGLVTDVLSPAFTGAFDAITNGGNAMKSFFDGLKDSVSQLIKKLITAAIEASALKALGFVTTGGLSSFGGIFSSLLGGAFGGQANRFALGGAIGSRAFSNVIQVNVDGRLSGQDILLSGQRAANSNGRGG